MRVPYDFTLLALGVGIATLFTNCAHRKDTSLSDGGLSNGPKDYWNWRQDQDRRDRAEQGDFVRTTSDSYWGRYHQDTSIRGEDDD